MNIVDSLIVTLGLDATAFKKGQREVNDSWQKARGTQLQHARAMEDGNKKLLESFNKLKTEAVGFFAALLGTREIKAFIEQINQANAAVGRLATNIGENPQMLQAWGSAVERFGGKAEDAQASLTALSKAFFDLKYNGKALPDSIYRAFAMTGRTVDTSKGLDAFLGNYAAALRDISKTDRSAAFWLGEGAGLTPSMVSLMTQYGAATLKFVEAQKGLGATDEQIRNSERLIEEWSRLKDTAEAIGRDIENWFSPAFLKILAGVQEAFDAIHGVTSQNPKDVANQIGMNEAAGGLAASGVTTNGTAVTKSNPLPVQIVPNANGGVTGSGQSWWDWLFGGEATMPSGGAGGAGSAPSSRAGSAGGEDHRTWWQRHAPRILGGEDDTPPSPNAPATPPPGPTLPAPNYRRLPRNLKNNNPGNVIDGPWAQSQPGYVGSDGHFAKFDTMDNGYRAANRNLNSYANRGIVTPRQILQRWAPGNSGEGNDPDAYAERVRQITGMDPDKPLPTNPAARARMLRAITEVEGGVVSPYSVRQIEGAIGGPVYRRSHHHAVENPHAPRHRRSMYHRLWHGTGSDGSLPANYGHSASLSTIHNVHPVTTSSTSNAMHIAGGIHVNAPYATDARGIAADIYAALGSYQQSMGMQSGQV